MPMNDKTVRGIVGGHGHSDPVPHDHMNMKTLHSPGKFRGHHHTVLEGDLITPPPVHVGNLAIKTYEIFF